MAEQLGFVMLASASITLIARVNHVAELKAVELALTANRDRKSVFYQRISAYLLSAPSETIHDTCQLIPLTLAEHDTQFNLSTPQALAAGEHFVSGTTVYSFAPIAHLLQQQLMQKGVAFCDACTSDAEDNFTALENRLAQFCNALGLPLRAHDAPLGLMAQHDVPTLLSMGIEDDFIQLYYHAKWLTLGCALQEIAGTLEMWAATYQQTLWLNLVQQVALTTREQSTQVDASVWLTQWLDKAGDWCPDVLASGAVREFEDVTFVIAPLNQRAVLPEYLEFMRSHKPANSNNFVMLWIADEYVNSQQAYQFISAIDVAGDIKNMALFERICRTARYQHCFKLRCRANERRSFFHVSQHQPDKPLQQVAVSDVMCEILQELMVHSKPLRSYMGKFLLPFSRPTENITFSQQLSAVKYHRQHPASDARAEVHDSQGECAQTPLNVLDHLTQTTQAVRQDSVQYMDTNLQASIFDVQETSNQAVALNKAIKEWTMPSAALSGFEFSNSNVINIKEKHATLQALVMNRSVFEYYNGECIFSASVIPLVTVNGKYLLHYSFNDGENYLEPALHQPSTGVTVGAVDVDANFAFRPKLTIDLDNSSWWYDLVFSDVATLQYLQSMQVHYWLSATQKLRNTYTAFTHADYEGKYTLKIESAQADKAMQKTQLFAFMRDFLEADNNETISEFLASCVEKYPDNRMYVSVAYGMSGPIATSVSGKLSEAQLFELAANVDCKWDLHLNATHAYNPAHGQKVLEPTLFNRWKGITFVASYHDYANVYLGYGRYFCEKMLCQDIDNLCFRMLLVSIFYRSTLRKFSQNILEKSQQLRPSDKHGGVKKDAKKLTRLYEEFRQLRGDFIEFTNEHWFDKLTYQVQGKEIFELQKKGLEIPHQYTLLKDEMHWADEYIQSQQAMQSQASSDTLNKTVFIFAVLALLFQVLSYETDTLGVDKMLLSGGMFTLLICGLYFNAVLKGRFKKVLLVIMLVGVSIFSGGYYVNTCESPVNPLPHNKKEYVCQVAKKLVLWPGGIFERAKAYLVNAPA